MSDPILIVGAGPTGLTAALELARLGQAVRLIDKRDGPATTSRAIGVQARTLELFEQRGLADEMVRLGNKGTHGSIYGGGSRVFRLGFGHIDSRYPYILFISQAETERILRDALAKNGVQPEWRTALVGIQQDAMAHGSSPAHAVLERPDGSLEHLAAPWIVSGEGAHSLIRTTLDLPFEGHTREEQYALGDLLIDGALADTDFHVFSSPSGFMGLFPMGGKHFRLIASNPPGTPSPDTAPSLETLQAIYDERSPIPARFHDMTWSSWFRINSRMVSRLRVGRLFVGGDSAHIHSPAGAQGMNTGIQDMINLGWKLAAVTSGQAPEALLDTYAADRLPVMRNVLNRTDALTTTIGTQNPVVRTLFNHLGPFIGGAELVQENATENMSQLALGYRDSDISAHHAHGGSLHAGDRLPELLVRHDGQEKRLLTLLDPSRPTLLVARAEGDAGLDVDGMHSVVVSPVETKPFTDLFGRHGCAVLVRPDGYAAVTSPLESAARHVAAWCAEWMPKASTVEHSA